MFTRHSMDPDIDTKCLWFALISVPLLFVLNFFMPRETNDVYYHDMSEDLRSEIRQVLLGAEHPAVAPI